MRTFEALVRRIEEILIPEDALTPDSLAEQVALVLGNPRGAATMAHAALDAGAPDATERLVALVEELAERTDNR